MMLAFLIAGVGAILAGLLMIVYGISIHEFGIGNTFILVGTVGLCTGMILLGLRAVVGELKLIVRGMGAEVLGETEEKPALPPGAHAGEDSPFGGQIMPDPGRIERVVPRRREEPSRERSRAEAPPLPEAFSDLPELSPPAAESAPREHRNPRRDRERMKGRTGEGSPSTNQRPPPFVVPEPEPPSASFDDAWPPPRERRSPESFPQSRGPRNRPAPFPEPGPPSPAASEERHPSTPPAPPSEDPPAVTVLKSGVVDGMAYSLYSDGSIEAQMPEGMMRFASVDELRAYLDHKS
jgi:hypothetical protein